MTVNGDQLGGQLQQSICFPPAGIAGVVSVRVGLKRGCQPVSKSFCESLKTEN